MEGKECFISPCARSELSTSSPGPSSKLTSQCRANSLGSGLRTFSPNWALIPTAFSIILVPVGSLWLSVTNLKLAMTPCFVLQLLSKVLLFPSSTFFILFFFCNHLCMAGCPLHHLLTPSHAEQERMWAHGDYNYPHSVSIHMYSHSWSTEPNNKASLLQSNGEGNGNPLQCSCLENPVDRGVWWASVHGVAQNRTRLKWLSSSNSSLQSDLCFSSDSWQCAFISNYSSHMTKEPFLALLTASQEHICVDYLKEQSRSWLACLSR